MKNIAFAHSVNATTLRRETTLLMEALGRLGIISSFANWRDTSTRWQDYDAIFIKSCSEYYLYHDAFIAWLEHIQSLGIPTINDTQIIRWNMDKHYLQTLEKRGFPIVPSRFFSQGESCNLAEQLTQVGWTQAIIKPCISAGAYETIRFEQAQASQHQAAANTILQSCDLILQPFMDEIITQGEWSLLFVEDRFSHAVIKNAKAGDFRIQDVHGGTYQLITPPESLIDYARQALAVAPAMPIYGRVDGIFHHDEFLIMEVELIEPFLYSTIQESIIQELASALALNCS